MFLVVVKCHELDKWGIHLRRAGKDRAQLLEFWGNNKQEEFLQNLIGILTPSLKPLQDCDMRVKDIPPGFLADFRKIARAAKQKFYNE